MSLIIKRICPVLRCKFHTHPRYAELCHIKGHLKRDHDYKELQQTAFSLGLVNAVYDKRGVTWLVDSLSDFSRVPE